MIITQEMINVASKKLSKQLECVMHHNAEALAGNMLEAVFASIDKDISMSSGYECGCEHHLYGHNMGGEAKFCKEHIPPLLSERVNFWEQPTDTQSNTEDKSSGLEAELHEVVTSILDCKDLDKLKEVTLMNFPEYRKEQSVDNIPTDDGWIEYKSNRPPDYPLGTKIEVKFYDGEIREGLVGQTFIWASIIAYRIIPEAKQKEPDICQCAPDSTSSITKQGNGRWKCDRCNLLIPEAKEEKKEWIDPDYILCECGSFYMNPLGTGIKCASCTIKEKKKDYKPNFFSGLFKEEPQKQPDGHAVPGVTMEQLMKPHPAPMTHTISLKEMPPQNHTIKKQTLLQIAHKRTDFGSCSSDIRFLIEAMSEYLEQSK